MSTSKATSAQPTIRRRVNPSELQQAGVQMKKACNLLNNVIRKRTADKEEDECDLFGKMLAKKLKKLPEYEREEFMYEIDGMFIRRLRSHNSTTTFTNTSTSEHLSPRIICHTPSSNESNFQRPLSNLSSYSEPYEENVYNTSAHRRHGSLENLNTHTFAK